MYIVYNIINYSTLFSQILHWFCPGLLFIPLTSWLTILHGPFGVPLEVSLACQLHTYLPSSTRIVKTHLRALMPNFSFPLFLRWNKKLMFKSIYKLMHQRNIAQMFFSLSTKNTTIFLIVCIVYFWLSCLPLSRTNSVFLTIFIVVCFGWEPRMNLCIWYVWHCMYTIKCLQTYKLN